MYVNKRNSLLELFCSQWIVHYGPSTLVKLENSKDEGKKKADQALTVIDSFFFLRNDAVH